MSTPRKISPDKQITFLKTDMTMQFIPVSKTTGKPIILEDGPQIYTDQRELMDALIRSSVKDTVVIMSRYISKWRTQSSVSIHANIDMDTDAAIFDTIRG